MDCKTGLKCVPARVLPLLVPKDEEPQHYRAYSTDVSGTAHELSIPRHERRETLGVRQVLAAEGQGAWVKDARMSDVEDTPKAKLAFITQHLNDTDLYEDFCACAKATPKEK